MKSIIYLLTLTTSLWLVGCGGESNHTAAKETTKTAKQSVSNQKIEKTEPYVSPLPDEAPVYSLAMIDYAPFAFTNIQGESTGYDVDLIRAIGEASGFKVNISSMKFEKLFDSVESGNYDIAMSALILTNERENRFLTSNPYAVNKSGFVVKADSPYKTVEDVLNKKIAVLKDSYQYHEVTKMGADKIRKKPTIFSAYQAVFTGDADAALGEEPSLFYNSLQFAEHPVRFIDLNDTIDHYVIYANKNNQEMITKINQGLEKVISSGKYHQLNEKWFGKHAMEIEMK